MSGTEPERISRQKALEHDWRVDAHVDGHHWYGAEVTCLACGGHAVMQAERSPKGYGLLVMQPATCDRCAELVGGARRRPLIISFVAGEDTPCHA